MNADEKYRAVVREELLEEIRRDPTNTLFGMPLPEVHKLVLEHQAKSPPVRFMHVGMRRELGL